MLSQKLGAHKVNELDDEEILNPDEVLKRDKLGIDTNFIVKLIGEGSFGGDYARKESQQERMSFASLVTEERIDTHSCMDWRDKQEYERMTGGFDAPEIGDDEGDRTLNHSSSFRNN